MTVLDEIAAARRVLDDPPVEPARAAELFGAVDAGESTGHTLVLTPGVRWERVSIAVDDSGQASSIALRLRHSDAIPMSDLTARFGRSYAGGVAGPVSIRVFGWDTAVRIYATVTGRVDGVDVSREIVLERV